MPRLTRRRFLFICAGGLVSLLSAVQPDFRRDAHGRAAIYSSNGKELAWWDDNGVYSTVGAAAGTPAQQTATYAMYVFIGQDGKYYVKDNTGQLVVQASVITAYGALQLNAGTYNATTTTAGIQEAITAIKSGVGKGGVVFIGPGVFATTAAIAQNCDSLIIQGSGMGDTANSLSTTIKLTGNVDCIDITGRRTTIRDLALMTSAAQSAGIALNINAYNCLVQHVNIGAVTSSQYFWIGAQMGANSQYSTIEDSFINNCVSVELFVTGGANNRTVHNVAIVNWGTNIFASNPIGLKLDNTQGGDFFTNLSIATCGTAISIAPGAGQLVFEEYFVNVDVVNNWGAGLAISATSTGQARNLNFINPYICTNAQAAASTAIAVQIQSGASATAGQIRFIGGQISNNANEGVVIGNQTGSGDTTKEVYFDGVDITDNDISNTSITYDGFGSLKKAGLLVNSSNAIVGMVGGALDNPAIGTAGGLAGNQTGVIVSRGTDVRLTSVEMSRSLSGPFGDAAGNVTRLRFCHGYNPAARATITVTASPFTYQNTDTAPESVMVLGGTVSAIAVSRDNTTYDSTTLTQGQFVLQKGDYIKVTYSGLPTMTKFGWE